MISPTMMMETELDTDTDTVEDNEDRHNIYEEVLNNETFLTRHNPSKVSSTSSIYRAAWWGRPSESQSLSYQVRQLLNKPTHSICFDKDSKFCLSALSDKVG